MSVDVKICGLTNRDDALAALDSGADYLGFVLYSKSPRSINALDLARLLDRLGRPCRAIGVFVNESRSKVEKTAADCGLYAVQIHGDETAEEFSGFSLPVWRAVKFVSGTCVPSPLKWIADRYVVDSAVAGMYGGTGIAGDWTEAGKFAGKHPSMLSGGLTPENVAEAIRIVHPLGVDTASGVESKPGRKDIRKLEVFLRNARTGS